MKKLTGDVLLAKKSGRPYIPNKGHIIWIYFDDPAVGHEQQGHRRALVISPLSYNRKTRLAVVCPITSSKKDYTFAVSVPEGGSTKGVVLADQMKSIDWDKRKATYIEEADEEFVKEVIKRINTLLQ